MKNNFENYLIDKGYSKKTPTGHPSTVYDYIKRINKVAEWEGMSWESMAKIAGQVRQKYDLGGDNEALGTTSHNAVICALRQFEEFCQEEKK